MTSEEYTEEVDFCFDYLQSLFSVLMEELVDHGSAAAELMLSEKESDRQLSLFGHAKLAIFACYDLHLSSLKEQPARQLFTKLMRSVINRHFPVVGREYMDIDVSWGSFEQLQAEFRLGEYGQPVVPPWAYEDGKVGLISTWAVFKLSHTMRRHELNTWISVCEKCSITQTTSGSRP